MTHEPLTLSRAGDAPLQLTGRIVATATGRREPLGKRDHGISGHDVELVESADGQWIVLAHYYSDWEADVPHTTTAVLDAAGEVRGWLRAYDPVADWSGMPPTAPSGRLARYRAYLCRQWGEHIERLLADLPATPAADPRSSATDAAIASLLAIDDLQSLRIELRGTDVVAGARMAESPEWSEAATAPTPREALLALLDRLR